MEEELDSVEKNETWDMVILMDIMWPISQSHFHVSYLCSLK